MDQIIAKDNFLQLVLDNIPTYVFWKDRDCVYLGCNKNFAFVAGLNSPEEIVGKNDFDLPWSKEDSDFYRKTDQNVMASGKAQIDFEEFQTVDNGSQKWLRTSKIPLYDIDGKVFGVLGTYEDITAKKEMEIQLRKQAKKLELKNKNLEETNLKLEKVNIELEQFTHAISHDLQEPLRMIGGFAGLLTKNYSNNLDNTGLEYLNYIKEGSARMSTLIRDVFSYSDLNKDSEQFETHDVSDIVTQSLADLDQALKDAKVSVKINLPKQKIYGQSEKLCILFDNLISNAINFNDSENPTIEINFQEEKEHWVFSVSDNGIGIDEDYKDYIFKPFKRLNNRKNYPGVGVGLSICQRIVNMHGGKIWCEQNKPKGTIFYFTLKKSKLKK